MSGNVFQKRRAGFLQGTGTVQFLFIIAPLNAATEWQVGMWSGLELSKTVGHTEHKS